MANNLATVVPALRTLMDAEGILSPAAVVDAARDPGSPLHRYFTWDDGEAADKCRLTEAGMLIRRVRIHLVRVPREPQQIGVSLMRVDSGGSVWFLRTARQSWRRAAIGQSMRSWPTDLGRRYGGHVAQRARGCAPRPYLAQPPGGHHQSLHPWSMPRRASSKLGHR